MVSVRPPWKVIARRWVMTYAVRFEPAYVHMGDNSMPTPTRMKGRVSRVLGWSPWEAFIDTEVIIMAIAVHGRPNTKIPVVVGVKKTALGMPSHRICSFDSSSCEIASRKKRGTDGANLMLSSGTKKDSHH